MQKSPFSSNPEAQNERMRRYYRNVARVYDLTRWAFLFGRKAILKHLAIESENPVIVEVGCGTGHNLKMLGKRFPNANLVAFDVSGDMLAIAEAQLKRAGIKADLRHQAYQKSALSAPADLILFSYSLTMINPQWETLISQAREDLKPGGKIAVVDFHDTRSKLLRGHMDRHHVRMDGHLLPELSKLFEPIHLKKGRAYFGWWTWLEFVGEKGRE